MKVLVLIPARYESSRFPGKPLAELRGKSVIRHIYDRLCPEEAFSVCVVTNNEKIEDHLRGFGGNVCRVDDTVSSGSQRVYLCYKRFFSGQKVDFIVNVQGDEPLIASDDIMRLVEFHSKNRFDVTTLVSPRKDREGFHHADRVKVAYTEKTRECHYFSRSPIPSLCIDSRPWFLHIGVYCFTPDSLAQMCESPPSPLEEGEGLEQLRAVEGGMTIGAIETDTPCVGIDSPGDLKRAERIIDGQS